MASHCLQYSRNPPSPTIRAANLGGWLVAEGWMTPWLFRNIKNNDLLDGTKVQLKSVKLNKYLTTAIRGGGAVVATKSTASSRETFKLWRVTSSIFQFKVSNNTFIGVDYLRPQKMKIHMHYLAAFAKSPGTEETFNVVRKSGDENLIRLRALSSGLFVQANVDGSVSADYARVSTSWEDDDPSVFNMTIVSSIRGEFQLTNGYGKDEATQVMRDHYNSYIDEDDFKNMSDNGINAVRIPVGYWIAYDNNPPAPFVGGSLAALDNAFTWARKHGIKVIVDLHAPPKSPNGNDNSASRDGSVEWGEEDIDQTIEVIDFLASRYAKRSSFFAMELINEPYSFDPTAYNLPSYYKLGHAARSNFLALEMVNEPQHDGVPLDTLQRYYKLGYDTVRKYSNCYVIMSNRLGPNSDPTELLQFAGRLDRTVIDVHYYNLYWPIFKNMTAQQNIDYVNNQRVSDLKMLTKKGGPLVFVGEWTAEWELKGAKKEEYRNFAAAQLKVFGQASFGWAYWSWKNVHHHWDLEWMINNGYISPLQN